VLVNILGPIGNHLLAIVTVLVTFIFLYFFWLDRGLRRRLSRKYKDSIFETQSQIFLKASQHLIQGSRDLAIKEFLQAIGINKEAIETHFALGRLFRSNGEIDKAIGIHRALVAKEGASDSDRILALKELAVDFDKGGFLDEAIETYKDVLKFSPDDGEVLENLCRLFEDIEDWDQAYIYRLNLSKSSLSQNNQAETISHILVQKAQQELGKGNLQISWEILEDAFSYAPSLSAKFLKLTLFLHYKNLEGAKQLLQDILLEYPDYSCFIFSSLLTDKKTPQIGEIEITLLKDFFLSLSFKELDRLPAIILTRVEILLERKNYQKIKEILTKYFSFVSSSPSSSEKNLSQIEENLKIELIKALINLGEKSAALETTLKLFEGWRRISSHYYCAHCGFESEQIFWRCPQCYKWETIKVRF